MGTKLLVISMDAMITEDLPNVGKYHHFRKFLKEAACVRAVRSIYPTLTYPCHTTMLTGVCPARHGVLANEPFLPGTKPLPWFFCHDIVQCKDLLDLCRENGLKTAAVGWPVTGNHPSVDYLVDEIWSIGIPWTKETMRETLLGAGTTEELFESVVKPIMDLRVPRRQPESSFFNTRAACGILRKYRPDVLVLHVSNFDSYRHAEGVFGEKCLQAAKESDEMLGLLYDALRENGDADTCNVVVTSDHGQLDCKRKANLNVLLSERGFITLDDNKRVKDWRAYSLSAGMSAFVYLRDPDDVALRREVGELLTALCSEGIWGFSRVFTKEETTESEGLAGAFSFVLETDGETGFENEWSGPYFVPVIPKNGAKTGGGHGFHPDKGPRPVFLCRGPAFQGGAVLETADLVDEAPTLAAAIGIEMPDADGRVLTELLNRQ